MREAEVGAADMIVQDAVSAEFVQHDAPVGRDTHRVHGVGEVGQRKAAVVDAVAVADAVRVDGVALIAHVALAAVIDLDREGGAVEVAREREAELFDQLEEAVDMVVGIDGGELVGARVIVEVQPDVAVWWIDIL
ncbi:MAG: hypothetical protein NTX37_04660 [Burkholderiales bacterium]|nr:hypothetical protein [Burkholderiales bacterium]